MVSKRFTAIFAILLLLTASSIVTTSAQPENGEGLPSEEPILLLTETDINDGFQLSNSATISFSNVIVDLQDGNHVAISFDASVRAPDGTVTTNSIIAILIGLVRPSGFMDFTDDACMFDGIETAERQQIRVCEIVARAWNRYLRQQYRGLPQRVVMTVDDDQSIIQFEFK